MKIKSNLLDACLETAKRLTDIDAVISTSLKQENRIPVFDAPPWDPPSLSHGYPSLICLFSEFHMLFPTEGWDHFCNQCIHLLVQEIEDQGFRNSSLFSGIAGICFAIKLGSQEGKHYRILLSKLNAKLLERVKIDYLDPLRQRIQEKQPIPPELYDTILGLSGVLTYLLEYIDEKNIQMIEEGLACLVAITLPQLSNGCQIPGWLIPPHHITLDFSQAGGFDTGLAHGIAGCLSIFSKATLKGILVPGQKEAMGRIISWFKATQCNLGLLQDIWPGQFGFDPSSKNHLEMMNSFHRDGWCYGTPGIAFSLFIASHALSDQLLYEESIAIMTSVCKRFPEHSFLTCPSFCHGFAGLLAMIYQMSLATQMTIFEQTSQKIADKILEHFDDTHPFGFKCIASYPEERQLAIDNCGLLDGTIGILLSLLFFDSKQQRPWLPIFLLA